MVQGQQKHGKGKERQEQSAKESETPRRVVQRQMLQLWQKSCDAGLPRMEGYQQETSVLGKLIARSTLLIRTGHRDCTSGSVETERRDGARDMHQREDLGEVDREREESGMTGELRVKCLRDNAVLPVRGTAGAAGYDISVASECVIPAHGKGSVDIGLAVSLPLGTYAQIAPRLGLAYQHFIDVGAGVVDSDF